MKFIKDKDGCYLNVANADGLGVIEDRFLGVHVFAKFGKEKFTLKKFDDKVAAQAWLDNLVAELNGESK